MRTTNKFKNFRLEILHNVRHDHFLIKVLKTLSGNFTRLQSKTKTSIRLKLEPKFKDDFIIVFLNKNYFSKIICYKLFIEYSVTLVNKGLFI